LGSGWQLHRWSGCLAACVAEPFSALDVPPICIGRSKNTSSRHFMHTATSSNAGIANTDLTNNYLTIDNYTVPLSEILFVCSVQVDMARLVQTHAASAPQVCYCYFSAALAKNAQRGAFCCAGQDCPA
jgi:hypothetical protein